MFEYDDNPGQQMQPVQPPQPQQNVPGEIELPFGPDDALELQRLTKNYAQVGKDLASNKILPQLATQTRARMAPQIQQLTQRQEAAQAKKTTQALQAQQQALMHESALKRSVQQQDAHHWAQGFQPTVAPVIDPLTGETLGHFYLNGEGGVEQIKREKPEPAAGGADVQLPPMGSSPMTLGLGLAAQTPGLSAPLPAGSEADLDQAAPVSLEQFVAQQRGQGATVPPPGTVAGTPQILNSSGENIDRRLVPRAEPEGADVGLSPKAMQEIYRRADRAIPQLPFDAPPHAQLQRQHLVNELVGKQVDNHHLTQRAAEVFKHREQQHRQDMQAKEHLAELERQGKEHEARIRQKERLEVRESGQGLSARELVDTYRDARKELAHQHAKWAGDILNDGKPVPDHLKPENHHRSAEEVTSQAHAVALKLLGKQPAGQQGGSGTPTRASPEEQKKAFQAVGTSGGLPGADLPKSAGSGGSASVSPERLAQILPHVQVIADHFRKNSAPGNLQKDADTMLGILKKGTLTPADHATYDLHKQSLFNAMKGPGGPQDTSVLDLLGPVRKEGGQPAAAPEPAAAATPEPARETMAQGAARKQAERDYLQANPDVARRRALETRARQAELGVRQKEDKALVDDAGIFAEKLAKLPGMREIGEAANVARGFLHKGLTKLTPQEMDQYEAALAKLKRK